MFLKLIILLLNREIIGLNGEALPQTDRLFESVNQSSITLLRWSAKELPALSKKRKNSIKLQIKAKF